MIGMNRRPEISLNEKWCFLFVLGLLFSIGLDAEGLLADLSSGFFNKLVPISFRTFATLLI